MKVYRVYARVDKEHGWVLLHDTEDIRDAEMMYKSAKLANNIQAKWTCEEIEIIEESGPP